MHHSLPDVKLDQFEGPYDLLIEMARQEKVDLSEISLRDLTQSFLAYMKQAAIPAELVASFIIVASTLLLMKARQALAKLTPEEDEEVEMLQERLSLYERYRGVAEELAHRWWSAPLLPAHFFAEGEYRVATEGMPLPSITPDMLADAMKTVGERVPAPSRLRAHLTPRGRSLKQLLGLFQERLRSTSSLVFQETMKGSSRQEVAVSFLAVLEMARNGEVGLQQQKPFSPLTLHRL